MYKDKNKVNCINTLRKIDATLLGFFNIKRYPLRAEKRQMAELVDVTLQYVINFFYQTRSCANKFEKETGLKYLYKLKPNSLKIEPITGICICDKNHTPRWFYFSNQNNLYLRLGSYRKNSIVHKFCGDEFDNDI